VKDAFKERPLVSEPHPFRAASWSTAAFGQRGAVVESDLSSLGAHLHECRVAHQRLFSARCVAEMANNFAAARIVSSWVVLALIGVTVWLLV
jgi:hypothetical protein